jgi:hypothetical protein
MAGEPMKSGLVLAMVVMALMASGCLQAQSPKNVTPVNVSPSITSPPVITPELVEGPCRSEEDWHKKADQTGAWMDGLLVDQALSDTEIMSVLASHNISPPDDIRISSPHFIGYYLELPESQYQQVQDLINGNQTITNLSFSSPMYGFTYPAIKMSNNSLIVPVMVQYDTPMDESMSYRDLVNRGIPIRKSKVVEIYYLTRLSPADREQLLNELFRDDRVLFTFKEYLEGVSCEYPDSYSSYLRRSGNYP